jgi:hypothetical protein
MVVVRRRASVAATLQGVGSAGGGLERQKVPTGTERDRAGTGRLWSRAASRAGNANETIMGFVVSYLLRGRASLNAAELRPLGSGPSAWYI